MAVEKGRQTRTTIKCNECPLRNCNAFATNSDDELEFLASLKLGERALSPGEMLIAEHSKSGELFTLLVGWGFRFKTLSDGRRQILNFLMPGDFIGLQQKMDVEMAHGVEMLTPATVCRLARDSLWEIHKNYPSMAYDVTWLAAHEESLVDENLLGVGRRSAAERIASFLVQIYRRALPLYGDNGEGVPFPINQQHISDALGLSIVHTNKTLRKLAKQGFYQVEQGRLRLLDIKALKILGDVSVGMQMPPRRLI